MGDGSNLQKVFKKGMYIMTIPRAIYYCWFGGNKPQPVLDCIENWREKLPNYEIIEINEHNKELFDIEKECQNNLWFKTIWENKMWAYVADYARLKVLYERGGVYFDTDVTVEKDITELLEKNKLVLGWEDKQSINIAVGVVIVGNPLIKEMLDFYNEDIWHSKLYTIPQIATYVLRKHYNLNSSIEITENDDILILPQEYFYPLPIGIKVNANYVTPNTYTIHWWDASWVKSNIDYFMKNKHKIELNKLLKQCFEKKVIINNKFLNIEKLHQKYSIEIDWYYAFRFKHKYYDTKKFLTLFILGVQIPVWRTR